MNSQSADLLVIGAGPAGLAAAAHASERGLKVVLVDENPAPGGQIWRGGNKRVTHWVNRFQNRVTLVAGAQVFAASGDDHTLSLATGGGSQVWTWKRLLLATGSRELFLPFPGWTLPGIFGAGGLQALVKSGFSVQGKRIVVAGTGPLLLAVARYLSSQGAEIARIAEQAPFRKVARFGASLIQHPEKLLEASQSRVALWGVPYQTHCWIEAAQGTKSLHAVQLRSGNKRWTEPCDFAAVGFGLSANTELGVLLGCELQPSGIQVDELQMTSVKDIYAAGEVTGVGGEAMAEVEGAIAGCAAADDGRAAQRWFSKRARLRKFSRQLQAAFTLRPELRQLVTDETIVCRCEDVRWETIRGCDSWREAKLHVRCGMGPCQGRVCGPALTFLKAWQPSSIRSPIVPTFVGNLISSGIRADSEAQNE